jgi:hypothetical protein
MNKKIIECLVKSGLSNEDIMDIMSGSGTITSYALEQFAELIIEECAEFSMYWTPMENQGSAELGRDMKQHFGVNNEHN